MSKLAAAIKVTEAHIAKLDPSKVIELNKTLSIDAVEHHAYQNMQAEAHASGRLSTEDALVVYAALGETGSASNRGWAKGTTVGAKYVITYLMLALAQPNRIC